MTPAQIENALKANHEAIQDELKKARDHEARATTHYKRVRPLMEERHALIIAQRIANDTNTAPDLDRLRAQLANSRTPASTCAPRPRPPY